MNPPNVERINVTWVEVAQDHHRNPKNIKHGHLKRSSLGRSGVIIAFKCVVPFRREPSLAHDPIKQSGIYKKRCCTREITMAIIVEVPSMENFLPILLLFFYRVFFYISKAP